MNDDRFTTATPCAADRLRFREHVLHGVDAFPAALDALFPGANRGKRLIDLKEPR